MYWCPCRRLGARQRHDVLARTVEDGDVNGVSTAREQGVDVVHAFDNDDKLIPSKMCDDIVRSCAAFQARREVNKYLVSEFLAIGMADVGEPVNLDHE